MKPVRLGIIGCGGYAFELIKRIWTLPRNVHLVSAVSLDPADAQSEACAKRGARLFRSLDEMLDHEAGSLDVILNPTSIHTHLPLTLRCLEAGLPVWLEKPPVATVQDLDKIAAAAAKAGRRVDVCFNALYGTVVQQLKKELVEGRFGKVRRVRSVAAWIRGSDYFQRNTWAGRLKADGAWVLDGSINNPLAHAAANSLYFAAAEHHELASPESVEALLVHGNQIESEDTSSLRAVTAGGVEVVCNFTLCAEEIFAPSTVIDADLAEIELHDFSTVNIHWRDGRKESRESYKENRVEMLEELALGAAGQAEPICDISMCRPFTVMVNAAFEAFGHPQPVSPDWVERAPVGATVRSRIRGINSSLLAAHRDGRMLTKETAPWVPECGRLQGLGNYERFAGLNGTLSGKVCPG